MEDAGGRGGASLAASGADGANGVSSAAGAVTVPLAFSAPVGAGGVARPGVAPVASVRPSWPPSAARTGSAGPEALALARRRKNAEKIDAQRTAALEPEKQSQGCWARP